jgi:hypothetical protein
MSVINGNSRRNSTAAESSPLAARAADLASFELPHGEQRVP